MRFDPDTVFARTFTRRKTNVPVRKDAVLPPFNFSNLIQPSDVRAHRFVFADAADPRVTLSLTGIVSQRANGPQGGKSSDKEPSVLLILHSVLIVHRCSLSRHNQLRSGQHRRLATVLPAATCAAQAARAGRAFLRSRAAD